MEYRKIFFIFSYNRRSYEEEIGDEDELRIKSVKIESLRKWDNIACNLGRQLRKAFVGPIFSDKCLGSPKSAQLCRPHNDSLTIICRGL